MLLNLLNKKADLFEELDPERIYVENIRSFFNIPSKLAKFFCDMAVKDRLFVKKYGVYCYNEECGRLIKSFDSISDVEDEFECFICKDLEREKTKFLKNEIEIIEFYQLKHK